jgi:hypothetical protein
MTGFLAVVAIPISILSVAIASPRPAPCLFVDADEGATVVLNRMGVAMDAIVLL